MQNSIYIKSDVYLVIIIKVVIYFLKDSEDGFFFFIYRIPY